MDKHEHVDQIHLVTIENELKIFLALDRDLHIMITSLAKRLCLMRMLPRKKKPFCASPFDDPHYVLES